MAAGGWGGRGLQGMPSSQARFLHVYTCSSPSDAGVGASMFTNIGVPYSNKHAEKRELLRSLALSRLVHGLEQFALAAEKDYKSFHTFYMSILRRSMRPITGCSSSCLRDEQICAMFEMLLPREAHTLALTRSLAQLAAANMPYLPLPPCVRCNRSPFRPSSDMAPLVRQPVPTLRQRSNLATPILRTRPKGQKVARRAHYGPVGRQDGFAGYWCGVRAHPRRCG